MSSNPLPIVLAIDVEPDPRRIPVRCSEPWSGFERLLGQIPRLRTQIAEATGRPAHFSWFLRADPQIEIAYGSARWGIDRYRAALDSLLAEGDEIGLHTHSWRWDHDLRDWLSDQADSDWVGHCASVALQTYAEAFGRPCRVYRHGDRYWSEALWVQLAKAGVRIDLSAEPGMPASAGLSPSERATGEIPYLPADWYAPFRVGGHAVRLMALPLTTVATNPMHCETLVPWLDPKPFNRGLQIRLADPRLTHLAFAIRTDLTWLSPQWDRFLVNLGTLARLRHVAFVTASRALTVTQRRG
jgi:hypothetical protein